MTKARLPLVAVLLLAGMGLGGCGNQRDLKPAVGAQLPPAPLGRDGPKNANELLKAPVEAKPELTVDSRVRSEERRDDPFDLPPEN